jgi:hypothetical protein
MTKHFRSFEENDYVDNTNANERNFAEFADRNMR